jgi:hypothetical protein
VQERRNVAVLNRKDFAATLRLSCAVFLADGSIVQKTLQYVLAPFVKVGHTGHSTEWLIQQAELTVGNLHI